MFKQYSPLLLLLLLLLLLSLLFTGCASNPEPSKPINFNYKAVENIEFKLQALPKNKLISDNSDWTKVVSEEISQRFSKAGYPISSSFNNSRQTPSHQLIAKVDETRVTKIQPGFSLDFGNSNPRASNFQKTLSAPINCTLQSLTDPNQSISLKELKSVPSPFETIGSSQQNIHKKLKRFYIENIGSTCHNLLNKLRIKQTASAKAESSTIESFNSPVRIETRYKSDKKTKPRDEYSGQIDNTAIKEVTTINTKETKKVATKKINKEIISDTKTKAINEIKTEPTKAIEKQASEESTKKDYFPAVTTEEKNSHDWRDAEVTIFNQGDTVILEFGNNR